MSGRQALVRVCFLVIASLAIVTVAVGGGAVAQADGAEVTVTPLTDRLTASPGETVTFQYEVANKASSQRNISVSLYDGGDETRVPVEDVTIAPDDRKVLTYEANVTDAYPVSDTVKILVQAAGPQTTDEAAMELLVREDRPTLTVERTSDEEIQVTFDQPVEVDQGYLVQQTVDGDTATLGTISRQETGEKFAFDLRAQRGDISVTEAVAEDGVVMRTLIVSADAGTLSRQGTGQGVLKWLVAGGAGIVLAIGGFAGGLRIVGVKPW